jgi:hypothetical protein
MRNFPDKPTAQDHMFQAFLAAASAVPVAGGPLQVLLESIFTQPLEQRRTRWFHELGSVVEEIKKRVDNFDPDTLSSNEAFVTTVAQATRIAMCNHQAEKLQALRNAVLNSGLPGSPSDDEQSIFLNLVDRLTSWHLRILSLLDNPTRWLSEHGKERPSVSAGTGYLLEYCFPGLHDEKELYEQIVKDLQSSGLLTGGSYMTSMMSNEGLMQSRTAPLGRRFLSFISDSLDS